MIHAAKVNRLKLKRCETNWSVSKKTNTFANPPNPKALKQVLVAVTNDLSTDQRVDKVCNTLVDMNFGVTLTGRRLPESLPLAVRKYRTHRMKLIFRRGPLFYAEFNIRLLLHLLGRKADLIVSNDLDTLPACYLAHKIKCIPVVYDSHEFYTETPELTSRPHIQHIWERIERFIFPKLNDIFTVNESIAALYKQRYGKQLNVVRNIPRKSVLYAGKPRAAFGLPDDKAIIILQGAGINIQRGAEEAIEAMKFINRAILLIVGSGDVIDALKQRVTDLTLSEKVRFMPKMPYHEMMAYTRLADVGLTLDKDTNLNYRFSLPNKLFDYIHAGIPVLASRLPEIARIVEDYNIGLIAESHDPEHIAYQINQMISEAPLRKTWQENLKKAATELTWENEEIVLKRVYSKYL